MSITLPDPDPAPPTPAADREHALHTRKNACYFGVYPHGMSSEGEITKIMSLEHLDRMLAETETTGRLVPAGGP